MKILHSNHGMQVRNVALLNIDAATFFWDDSIHSFQVQGVSNHNWAERPAASSFVLFRLIS